MALIETLRSSVQTWECDINGHMNVQFYVSHAVNSLALLGNALGLTPAYNRQHRVGLVAQEHHIRFQRERHPGDPIVMQGGVLASTDHEIHLFQQMIHSASGEISATFVTRCQLLDLSNRDVQPLPDFIAGKLAAVSTELPDYAAARGIATDPPRSAPRLEQADALGMLPTYTGLIGRADVDAQGYMVTSGYMAKVSDAIPVLITATAALERSVANGMGGAALEYRFLYRQTPCLGDIVTLRSGLKALGSKTYSWCHWLFDAVSGDCLATAEAVAVSLDLASRRAIALPEATREALRAELIPQLGV